jgi:hypothetical protein
MSNKYSTLNTIITVYDFTHVAVTQAACTSFVLCVTDRFRVFSVIMVIFLTLKRMLTVVNLCILYGTFFARFIAGDSTRLSHSQVTLSVTHVRKQKKSLASSLEILPVYLTRK